MGDGLTSDGGSHTDDGAHVDEEGLRAIWVSAFLERGHDGFDVVDAVMHVYHVPAAGFHLLVYVFGVCEVDAAVAGDLVVIVDYGEAVEFEMAGVTEGFAADALCGSLVGGLSEIIWGMECAPCKHASPTMHQVWLLTMSYPGRLNVAARCLVAIARPTAFAMPWPKGPVVSSMPSCSISG